MVVPDEYLQLLEEKHLQFFPLISDKWISGSPSASIRASKFLTYERRDDLLALPASPDYNELFQRIEFYDQVHGVEEVIILNPQEITKSMVESFIVRFVGDFIAHKYKVKF